jgi:hypothetical protein
MIGYIDGPSKLEPLEDTARIRGDSRDALTHLCGCGINPEDVTIVSQKR